jgi:hypothetical protein
MQMFWAINENNFKHADYITTSYYYSAQLHQRYLMGQDISGFTKLSFQCKLQLQYVQAESIIVQELDMSKGQAIIIISPKSLLLR